MQLQYNLSVLLDFVFSNCSNGKTKHGSSHITVLIPNTGKLTPQYIAVLWCTD